MISIEQVRKEFTDASKILSIYGLNNNTSHYQIFFGKAPPLWEDTHPGGCARHISVFNQYNVIPRYCFSCYKVSIKLKTVIELFKLMMVFETLELEHNNTRKCTVETREEVHGAYTGLIYCRSIQQGYKIVELVKKAVHEEISNEIPVTLKRGCSEFPLAYSDFAEIANTQSAMTYPDEWMEKETLFDKEHTFNQSAVTFNSCEEYSNHTFKRAIALYTWLQYASAIGDSSYLEITDIKVTPLQGLKRPTPGATLKTLEKNWDKRQCSVQDIFIEAYQYHKSGNYQKAKQGYRYVLGIKTDHADANHMLGILATQEGDYKYAIRLIKKVLEKTPHSAEANFNLANSYLPMEKYTEAVHFYMQALNNKPDYIKALINSGIAYKFLNQCKHAIEANEKVISIQPDHAVAYTNLGDIYSESGHVDAALICYMQSIKLAPHCAEAYCGMADLHVKTGETGKAITFYRKAITLNPQSSEAHLKLAHVYLDTHQFTDAEKHFNTVLQYRGDNFQAHNGLGCVLREVNQLEEAWLQFNKALSINPNYDTAAVNLDKISNNS